MLSNKCDGAFLESRGYFKATKKKKKKAPS